jgi:hypothetical protein
MWSFVPTRGLRRHIGSASEPRAAIRDLEEAAKCEKGPSSELDVVAAAP